MPFHKGHEFCVSIAAALCETVHVVLFVNSEDETNIQAAEHALPKEYLTVENRAKQIENAIKLNPRIKLHVIDVSKLRTAEGKEDWDAETPLVLKTIGEFDAVFSSEPSYDAYFKRAYPWAIHVIVDAKRENFPISGTMVRDMTEEEALKWIVR